MKNWLIGTVILACGTVSLEAPCDAQTKTKWEHKILNDTDSPILVHVVGPKSQKDYLLYPDEVAIGTIWAEKVDVGVVYFGPISNQTVSARYDRRAANRTLHVTAGLYYGNVLLLRGRF